MCIGSVGFVIGRDGVLVVNTRTSAAPAREIIATIKAHTPLPLKMVILTQPWPEFITGAAIIAAGEAFAGVDVSAVRR